MLPRPSPRSGRCLLDPGAVESIARFRQILESGGYPGPKATEILGSGFGPNHLRADMPLYLRRLAAPEPLNILIKLFGLYVAVGEEEPGPPSRP